MQDEARFSLWTKLAVPCTTYRSNKRIYPTQVPIQPPDGGLTSDSSAITDRIRVLSKSRLLRLRGILSQEAIAQLNRSLLIALDLPGQDDEILLDV
ncbi:Transcriptional modulator of MazE/toxin MazF [Nostoc sp. DSM 114161]|uniref:type II toxin-antitoxin system PemK/MazF family toxin n=1 Tax=Nostoc sp. DSM 114161 TaxID=3440143 RepID=UPI00404610C7